MAASAFASPVPSLFPHVPQKWWKQVFNDEMYLRTDGDVVEDPKITQVECDEILCGDKTVRKCLEKKGKTLDLCCGQGMEIFSGDGRART